LREEFCSPFAVPLQKKIQEINEMKKLASSIIAMCILATSLAFAADDMKKDDTKKGDEKAAPAAKKAEKKEAKATKKDAKDTKKAAKKDEKDEMKDMKHDDMKKDAKDKK
jgi:uncharacterized membrane protein